MTKAMEEILRLRIETLKKMIDLQEDIIHSLSERLQIANERLEMRDRAGKGAQTI